MNFLFGGGNAARVFAFKNVNDFFGQFNIAFFKNSSVTDYIYRCRGTNEAQNTEIEILVGCNFDLFLLKSTILIIFL